MTVEKEVEKLKRKWGALSEKKRIGVIVLFTLVLVFSAQGIIWKNLLIIDGVPWTVAVSNAQGWDFPAEGEFTYGYPGMSLLLPAAGIVDVVGKPEYALRTVMPLLTTLAATIAVVVAYLLRPRSVWWFFVAWLYAFGSQVASATPPSGLMVAFLPVLVLLSLLAYERARPGIPLLAGIGAWSGLMLVTRLDMAVPFVAAATLLLSTRRALALYVVPLVALNVFLLLNPSFWIESPIGYLSGTFAKILDLAANSPMAEVNVLGAIKQASTFGAVALLLTIALIALRQLRSLPVKFMAALAALSVLLIAAIAFSHHHPSWMFSPFLVTFQVFLPLLVLDAFKALPENSDVKKIKPEGAFLRVLAATYLCLQVLTCVVDVSNFLTVYH